MTGNTAEPPSADTATAAAALLFELDSTLHSSPHPHSLATASTGPTLMIGNTAEPPTANAAATAAAAPFNAPINAPTSPTPAGTLLAEASGDVTSTNSMESQPLTAADVTTAAGLDYLKAAHFVCSTALSTEAEPREKQQWLSKIAAMRLPTPEALQWPLVELSADFKSAHSDSRLAKFNVAKKREWYNDDKNLLARLKVYILMRFLASKRVNEVGIVSYMSLESVHNLWILCRHVINYYESLDSGRKKQQVTKTLRDLTQRMGVMYKLKKRGSLLLTAWGDRTRMDWGLVPTNITLLDLCQFDLRCDLDPGTANVTDWTQMTTYLGMPSESNSWDPHQHAHDQHSA